ncbi:MAG: tRNA uridine-5-carboxymethylaminomethyl(34) synthesis GTPase MnmE [Acidobacteria bacterium]|nr:tRNA uridine-5-carboxymethylaminomethyl(34) synthesis GTPase MnmE [Acidobacteriota bacterium]MDW7984604.1 tRNA uridine-5-carboxymethylaminomethyl(34) synthesis GTPase MnmE [Acidobacteriota bacterium]
MLYPLDDTIVAVSTPPGRGAIGIVRLSGRRTVEVASRVFRPHAGSLPAAGIPVRRMVLGVFVDPAGDEPIDTGFLILFRGPRSFTGEDLAEFHLHGSPPVLRAVVDVLTRLGARLAQPGEFTYRAFVHGKIDLAQAEALNDLIQADALWQARSALHHLQGYLSRTLRAWKEDLIELIARYEAAVDFGEAEDMQFFEPGEAERRLDSLVGRIADLLATYRQGRALREGLRVVIVGKPNAGKSSLFNALLREPRAIVTPLPGTTRDFIKERLIVDGLAVELVDTAGVRPTPEVVERLGIERTLQQIAEADLVLWVLDGSVPLDAEDDAVYAVLRDRTFQAFRNKMDLPSAWPPEAFTARYGTPLRGALSCETGTGIADVMDAIRAAVRDVQQSWRDHAVVVTNARHEACLRQARKALQRAQYSLQTQAPEPIVLEDLRSALRALDAITGETDVEDILDRIFTQFCIGK